SCFSLPCMNGADTSALQQQDPAGAAGPPPWARAVCLGGCDTVTAATLSGLLFAAVLSVLLRSCGRRGFPRRRPSFGLVALRASESSGHDAEAGKGQGRRRGFFAAAAAAGIPGAVPAARALLGEEAAGEAAVARAGALLQKAERSLASEEWPAAYSACSTGLQVLRAAPFSRSVASTAEAATTASTTATQTTATATATATTAAAATAVAAVLQAGAGAITAAVTTVTAGPATAVLPARLEELMLLRRAEAFLGRGFSAEAAVESAALVSSSPLRPAWSLAAAALCGRALQHAGSFREAALLLRQVEAQGRPGQLLFAASTKAEDEASLLHELAESAALGARQELGDIDIARLMEECVLSAAPRLSASAGPLKFVSPKVERRVLGAGRGRGVVALQDLAVGEAFIVSRPLGLVTNAGFSAMPEHVARQRLADQLEDRARQSAGFAEELFSLYDGSDSVGALWRPQSWSPAASELPELAGGPQQHARIERIIRFNSHRVPGRQGQPGLGLWLWPPMVNHGLEGDSAPNCAHVFVGDAMLFRATRPVKAGEELLDRYTSPLAMNFEQTLEILEDHGMRDPDYQGCADLWQRAMASKELRPPGGMRLAQGRSELASILSALEGRLAASQEQGRPQRFVCRGLCSL
ncbi:unnamed protein product, partial [Polarella glacialis]